MNDPRRNRLNDDDLALRGCLLGLGIVLLTALCTIGLFALADLLRGYLP